MDKKIVCDGDTCRMEVFDIPQLATFDVDVDNVTLEWAPTSGHSRYQVDILEDGGEWRTLSDQLSGHIMKKKNLAAGQEYSFRIRGYIAATEEWGQFSEPFSVSTLATGEGRLVAPVACSVDTMEDGEHHAITVQWNPPQDESQVAHYQVQYRLMSAVGPWTTIGALLQSTRMKKKNLAAAKDWVFRVRWAPKSNPEVFSPWGAPSAPIGVKHLGNFFEAMFGKGNKTLVNAQGKPVDTRMLAGKLVGLYFSAHWCPPCRQFTPQLASFYNQLRAAGKPVEIVFLTADRDRASYRDYANSMPWLSVDFDASQKNDIMARYQVSGIPNLKFLDPQGRTICDNAVGALSFDQIDNWLKQCGLVGK